MTADNVTPINPTTGPDAATVGDLKAALTERHARGMSDAVAKVNALSVDVVKRATAEQITRTATDLAELAPLLVDNRARLSGQPDNPLEQAHRHLTELIRLYGVSEYLLGHGARRGLAQGQS